MVRMVLCHSMNASGVVWGHSEVMGTYEPYLLQLNSFKLFTLNMTVGTLTALFTKPPVGVLPAPFTAYGRFRNCTRQNHGTARNREAGGFVNNAVKHFPCVAHIPTSDLVKINFLIFTSCLLKIHSICFFLKETMLFLCFFSEWDRVTNGHSSSVSRFNVFH